MRLRASTPACPDYLLQGARQVWDEVLDAGSRFGFRNAQATVLAPTGTISFMMDCDTTGIEPDIALVKYKQLAGRGMMKIVNRSVAVGACKTLGYGKPQVDRRNHQAYIDENDTIEGCSATWTKSTWRSSTAPSSRRTAVARSLGERMYK